MIPDQYAWLFWATASLVPWALLYLLYPDHRRIMLRASLFTAPFGLTEPLFVPAYWTPPSLLGLAERTGFDVESILFSFGLGGVGAVLYNVLTRKRVTPVDQAEKRRPLHRHHYLAMVSPFVTFAVLYPFPWNPIYPGIAAMLVGGISTMLCRPDLAGKTWVGGVLFTGYYLFFLIGLKLTNPGYIESVWNWAALTGIGVAGIPIEELLFAFGFGFYWSGVYEHVTWTAAV